MRILSWNVNGIRATYKKGFLNWLFNEGPDVMCIQETKASTDVLPEELLNVKGYESYFFSSTIKKGYSGVGVYTKHKPKNVEYGLGIEKFDQEGRSITLFFDDFVLINAYFPNSGGGPERIKMKFDFNDAILEYMDKLKSDSKKVVLCGDLNVAHEEIDLARPKENDGRAGFMPEERAWMDEVLATGYVDTFRHLYPNKTEAYSWWDMKSKARDRNVGWRIDYFLISQNLTKQLKSAFILDYVMGSDHCPVGIELKF